MTKPKDFTSISGVVGRAVELIGAGAVATAIGKSEPWVYRLADSDNDDAQLKYIEDAIAIDAACIAKGSPAPFLNYYQRCIGLPQEDDGCLNSKVYSLGSATGQVMAHHKSARCPDGPAGTDYSPSERHSLKRALNEVRETCVQIENDSDVAGGTA